MANPILSPKRLAERVQRYRHAVIVFALQSAKKAVREQLRAQGLKPQHFSAREITLMAEDYLAQHRHQLCGRSRHPRIGVVATTSMTGEDFASLLDKAIARSGKVIEHHKVIDHEPRQPEPPPPPSHRPPLGFTPDRRYRRAR